MSLTAESSFPTDTVHHPRFRPASPSLSAFIGIVFLAFSCLRIDLPSQEFAVFNHAHVQYNVQWIPAHFSRSVFACGPLLNGRGPQGLS
jgi:hypothetical protein